MKIVKGIPQEKILDVLEWYIHFNDLMDEEMFKSYIVINTDFNISLMLLDDNEKIVGAYLLGNNQIKGFVKNTSKFDELVGIEGVLLFIEEEYKKLGWGTKLKDYTRTLGYDYIWGQQFKDLNNLEDWLKRRELVGESKFIYFTAEIF